MKINKCIHCGGLPKIVNVTDLFYVQCMCGRWNPYQFVGITKKTAIEQWNFENAIRIIHSAQPVKRKNLILYKYYLNGTETDLNKIAEYVDVPKKYIRDRFVHYGIGAGSVTIKKIVIERKEYRYACLPEK